MIVWSIAILSCGLAGAGLCFVAICMALVLLVYLLGNLGSLIAKGDQIKADQFREVLALAVVTAIPGGLLLGLAFWINWAKFS